MKQIFLDLLRYNVWANARIISLLEHLTEEQSIQSLGGSFPSVRETVFHIWNAESIWWQRLMMQEQIILPTENFNGGMKEAGEAWQMVSKELLNFCEKIYDDRGLEHEFVYHNLKKEPMKSKVSECLQHVCNHSTFHRGQLVNYLRMLGVTKIPSTDFITFCREKK